MQAATQRAFDFVRQAIMAIPDRIARDMSGFPADRVSEWRRAARGYCHEALADAAAAIRDMAEAVAGDIEAAGDDADAGRRAAVDLREAAACEIPNAFKGTPIEFCHAVKDRVPSAKPSRMRGMNSQRVRTQLRAGYLDGRDLDRLLAVAASLGYRAEIKLVPITSPPRAPLSAA